MRGSRERKCLDFVKYDIFYKNGTLVQNPFTKKTYLDITDEDFKENRLLYINSDCEKFFFGLLEEDRYQIENILRTASPNPNESEFPDFVFHNGFIEHFQISSSKTNRKGAVHKKKEQQFQTTVAEDKEKIISEWSANPDFNQVRSKSWDMDYPDHSYDYLEESFRNTWERHICSVDKYQANKDIGIFMIEYSEHALAMLEKVYEGWKNGMSQGDMREPEYFNCYRLSRDKKLLEYIYSYKEKVHYVIFVNCEIYEIIKTENIPYFLKLMPWDYIIAPLCAKIHTSLHNISVPMPFNPEQSQKQSEDDSLI